VDLKPVVALDIDGTLGDYHGHFTTFAALWIGRPLPHPSLMTDDIPFYKHLGMSKATYRQIKLAYRQGGMARSMPIFQGAADLTRDLRHEGAEVWLCTTRPYMRHDSTDPDTRHWLRRNRIQWDHIIYGPNKYRELIKIVPPGNILAVLDDLPEMLEQARSLWLPAFVRDQPYNQKVDLPRVADFMRDEWPGRMMRQILDWRRNGKRLDNRRH